MLKVAAFSVVGTVLCKDLPAIDNTNFKTADVIKAVDALPSLGLNIHASDVALAKKAAEHAHITPDEIATAERVLKNGVDRANEDAVYDDLKSHGIVVTPGMVERDLKAVADGKVSDEQLEYSEARVVEAYRNTVNPNTAEHGFLSPHDGVAISFWIISIAMVASTVFFLWESMSISPHWKTSMNVGSLVTLIAGVHYFYMREYWIINYASPIVYRYIDWSLTVPLQMIEFYLILNACKPDLSGGIFWRLLVGTVIMLAFGYAGESGNFSPVGGFAIGMAGWGFILYEIFLGEASQVAGSLKGSSGATTSAYSAMRFIVSVGWSIYPLGYFFGYLLGAVRDSPLNLIYNLADFVNKIAFCLVIWHAAKEETIKERAAARGKAQPLLG